MTLEETGEGQRCRNKDGKSSHWRNLGGVNCFKIKADKIKQGKGKLLKEG